MLSRFSIRVRFRQSATNRFKVLIGKQHAKLYSTTAATAPGKRPIGLFSAINPALDKEKHELHKRLYNTLAYLSLLKDAQHHAQCLELIRMFTYDHWHSLRQIEFHFKRTAEYTSLQSKGFFNPAAMQEKEIEKVIAPLAEAEEKRLDSQVDPRPPAGVAVSASASGECDYYYSRILESMGINVKPQKKLDLVVDEKIKSEPYQHPHIISYADLFAAQPRKVELLDRHSTDELIKQFAQYNP